MSWADASTEAIDGLRIRLESLVADYFADIEHRALVWYDRLVGKYGTTLHDLEVERETAVARLERHLRELGYG